MATFTLTYQQDRNSTIVLQLLNNRREESVLNDDMFKKCCGSIAYLSLFILPGFELADKGVYSIEQVCQHVPGLFKYDMHTLLVKLGAIACGDLSADNLQSILQLPTFYECFEFLKLKPAIWYKVFLWHFAVLQRSNITWEIINACKTYDEIFQLYNSGVIE